MRPLILLLLAVWLAGCTGLPSLPPVDEPELAWQQHLRQMQAVSSWRLNGRLLVINDEQTWHTGIHWRQQGEQYQIHITGPLGRGSVRLEGDPTQVTLLSQNGDSWRSNNPEALLEGQVGWRVPISALRYWVLGMPAAGEYRHVLNEAGLMERLFQGDWEIEFRDYGPRDGIILPGRIFANNHQARVRLVIGEWQQDE